MHTIASCLSAIFFAIVFTDPVLAYLNLNPDNYKIGVAAAVALTGEGIAKRILTMIADQKTSLSLDHFFRMGRKHHDESDEEDDD